MLIELIFMAIGLLLLNEAKRFWIRSVGLLIFLLFLYKLLAETR